MNKFINKNYTCEVLESIVNTALFGLIPWEDLSIGKLDPLGSGDSLKEVKEELKRTPLGPSTENLMIWKTKTKNI